MAKDGFTSLYVQMVKTSYKNVDSTLNLIFSAHDVDVM